MFPIVNFIQRSIIQGTPLLFGSTGEIITEKSGNLNLGIPGIMYIGGISDFPITFSIAQPPAPPIHMIPGIPRFRCPDFSVIISPVDPYIKVAPKARDSMKKFNHSIAYISSRAFLRLLIWTS